MSLELLVRAELIDSLLGVDFARVEDNAGEMRLIGAVREVLGFEAEATTTREGGTELALVAISPVVSVELHGGLGGVNLHGAAALGLGHTSSEGELTNFLLVDNEGVVVASTILNLLIIAVPIGTYGMRCAEVKRSALHLQNLACGDVGAVGGDEEVGIDLYHLILNAGSGVGNTLEGEEAVVRHVANGLLVAGALIINNEFVVVGESEHHSHLEFAGETFLIVSAGVTHHYGVVTYLLSIPHAGMETCGATMQMVGAIVDSQVVLLAIELELAAAYTVTITSHKSGEEGLGAVQTVVDTVMPLDDVGHLAVTVGYHNGHDGTAIIGDSYLAAICIGEEKEIDLLALYFLLEVGAFEATDGGYLSVHIL